MFLTSGLEIKKDEHFILFSDPNNTGVESFNETVK